MPNERLYSVFALLRDDTNYTVLLENVPEAEATQDFRDRREYMQGHGFRVKTYTDNCDNLPGCHVINPITGKQEVHYWIRETA